MRISDWSSDVCSSDLQVRLALVLDQFLDGVAPTRLGLAAQAGLEPRTEEPRKRLTGLVGPAVVAGLSTDGGIGHSARWDGVVGLAVRPRSEEHTSELKSLMRISYAVFCLNKTK